MDSIPVPALGVTHSRLSTLIPIIPKPALTTEETASDVTGDEASFLTPEPKDDDTVFMLCEGGVGTPTEESWDSEEGRSTSFFLPSFRLLTRLKKPMVVRRGIYSLGEER